jgi:alpha-glucosidase
LDRIPLFVRGGAIIPIGPVKQHDAEVVEERLTLLLYPAEGRTTELYRDDGISQAYRQGAYRHTRFVSRQERQRVTVTIEPAEDEELTLRIHMPSAPGSVTMDGAPGSSWRQADGFLTAVVPAGVARVEVEWAE